MNGVECGFKIKRQGSFVPREYLSTFKKILLFKDVGQLAVNTLFTRELIP